MPSQPAVAIDTCASLGAAVGAEFALDYTCGDMGAPPGVPFTLGGVVGVPGDPSHLIIAGNAGEVGATLYSVGVARDAECRILGFDGSPTEIWSTAPNQGGDLIFGPGDVLIYGTRYSGEVGQIKPGSVTPDRVVGFPGAGPPASKAFVPEGFPNAGEFKVAGCGVGDWNSIDLVPDGNGTYDLVFVKVELAVDFVSYGMSYVAAGSPQITETSMIYTQSEDGVGAIVVYPIDENAIPFTWPNRKLITGLNDPEGSYLDPLSGQFLFTTEYFGESHVLIVDGFDPQ